jgi:hypothetical protein
MDVLDSDAGDDNVNFDCEVDQRKYMRICAMQSQWPVGTAQL